MPEEISENERRRIQLDVWLSQSRMSKKELAAMIGVSESAVYGWFSNAKIPEKRWTEMKDYFCKGEEHPNPGCIAVQVEFSDEDWANISATFPDGVDKIEYAKKTMQNLIKAARLQ